MEGSVRTIFDSGLSTEAPSPAETPVETDQVSCSPRISAEDAELEDALLELCSSEEHSVRSNEEQHEQMLRAALLRMFEGALSRISHRENDQFHRHDHDAVSPTVKRSESNHQLKSILKRKSLYGGSAKSSKVAAQMRTMFTTADSLSSPPPLAPVGRKVQFASKTTIVVVPNRFMSSYYVDGEFLDDEDSVERNRGTPQTEQSGLLKEGTSEDVFLQLKESSTEAKAGVKVRSNTSKLERVDNDVLQLLRSHPENDDDGPTDEGENLRMAGGRNQHLEKGPSDGTPIPKSNLSRSPTTTTREFQFATDKRAHVRDLDEVNRRLDKAEERRAVVHDMYAHERQVNIRSLLSANKSDTEPDGDCVEKTSFPANPQPPSAAFKGSAAERLNIGRVATELPSPETNRTRQITVREDLSGYHFTEEWKGRRQQKFSNRTTLKPRQILIQSKEQQPPAAVHERKPKSRTAPPTTSVPRVDGSDQAKPAQIQSSHEELSVPVDLKQQDSMEHQPPSVCHQDAPRLAEPPSQRQLELADRLFRAPTKPNTARTARPQLNTSISHLKEPEVSGSVLLQQFHRNRGYISDEGEDEQSEPEQTKSARRERNSRATRDRDATAVVRKLDRLLDFLLDSTKSNITAMTDGVTLMVPDSRTASDDAESSLSSDTSESVDRPKLPAEELTSMDDHSKEWQRLKSKLPKRSFKPKSKPGFRDVIGASSTNTLAMQGLQQVNRKPQLELPKLTTGGFKREIEARTAEQHRQSRIQEARRLASDAIVAEGKVEVRRQQSAVSNKPDLNPTELKHLLRLRTKTLLPEAVPLEAGIASVGLNFGRRQTARVVASGETTWALGDPQWARALASVFPNPESL